LESLLDFCVARRVRFPKTWNVGGGTIWILWVGITAPRYGLSFVARLPLSSDLLGCRQFALFRLILGRGDDVTESLVEFFLQPGEVLPRERNQTALL